MKFTHSIPSSSPSLWGRAGVGLLLFLSACITEYAVKDMDEVSDILVVEGFISDDESVITLSRSQGLSFKDNPFDMSPYRIIDAQVYIECDDGEQWSAADQNSGEYAIQTGKLNPERQYRLKIEYDEHEYLSEYAYPMVTPEIDSIFWTKKDKGHPVNIHLATHAPDGEALYCRWWYQENWETSARISLAGYPYYCSKHYQSRELLLGTNEKNTSEQIIDILFKIPPKDDRVWLKYRMDVEQNAISKRAYDYYINIKINSRQTGSIFARIPSELQGNITCTTNPELPVIGFIDVSSTKRGRIHIYKSDNAAEGTFIGGCAPIPMAENRGGGENVYMGNGTFIERRCVDCEFAGGNPISELPDDWLSSY